MIPRCLWQWSTLARCCCRNNRICFLVDHEPIRPRILKWLHVCVVLIAIDVLLPETKAFGNAADFHVTPATGMIHDSFGRERIFHGLNVVMKGAPWHPRVDAFDPQLSFTDLDIELLEEWGMNVVRLGIMWPGVEPNRGHVNSTYLEIMRSIVSKLHIAGIYTLLEFHQDLYTSQFCGEGLPSWILDDNNLNPRDHVLQRQNRSFPFETTPAAARGLEQSATIKQDEHKRSKFGRQNRASEEYHEGLPISSSGHSSTHTSRLRRRHFSKRTPHSNCKLLSKMRYPASFPEPLGRRWPWPSEWEKDGWEPPVERCNKHSWWSYYFSYAVSRAFQDLYDNKWGWGDLLARYWIVVAGAFKDQPGVLGYELMNEPWPGDVFQNPLLFLPGVADTVNLAHFYEKLQAAVRSVDRERILFFETITFDNFRCGFSAVPGGAEWQNKTVLSYHYYTPPNFSAKQAFAERTRESKRLGCGSMLTEFFVSTEQDKRDTKEFWTFPDDILRFAEGEDVIQIPGTEVEAVSCDLARKDSLDVKCDTTGRTSDTVLKGTIPRPLKRVKGGNEEVIEDDERFHWGLEKGLEPLKIDVQTSLETENSQSDRQYIFMGVGGNDESSRMEVENGLEDKQAGNFTGVEEKKRDQTREKKVDSVDEVLLAADVHVQSWIGWEYKAFFNKTGSIVKQSLFDGNGEVNLVLAKKLARTYPQSVCGNINSFSFDPSSSLFTFSYVAGNECRDGEKAALTEIYFHRKFYYPHGLFVEINRLCASFSETDRIILVDHTVDCVGLVIDVRISRLDPLPTQN